MPLPVSQDTVMNRLRGIKDSRGLIGMFSRGKNVYKGASTAGNFQGAAQQKLGIGPTISPWQLGQPIKKFSAPAPQAAPPVQQAPLIPIATPKPPTSLQQYPYDQMHEMGLRDITRRESEVRSLEELARRRLLEDYGSGERDLNRVYGENLENLSQRMANQGILRSGINIQEQTDLGSTHGRQLEELTQGRARGEEDISRDVTGQMGQLTREKELLDYERTERVKQQELERAQREAEAKANAALLKSLQPNKSGTIELAFEKKYGYAPNKSPNFFKKFKKRNYGKGGLQIARSSKPKKPEPSMDISAAVRRRVGY